MDLFTSLVVGICLSPFFAIIAMLIPFTALLLFKHTRKQILPSSLPEPGGSLWLFMWIPVIIFVAVAVLFCSIMFELFIVIITVLITQNVDVMTGVFLFSAGPVEEFFKACGGAALFGIFYLISKRKGLLVREALFFGAIVGIGFGTVEAWLYFMGDLSALVMEPGFRTIDAVVWRVAFGALVHAILTGLALWPLGLEKTWMKIFFVPFFLALASIYHGALNLANLYLLLEGFSIVNILVVDAIQLFMLLALVGIFALLWHLFRPHDIIHSEDDADVE